MDREEVKNIAFQVMGRIAPEASLESLDPARGFRDQFDFDSVDFLNFALALQEAFKLVIPEMDYPKLATLDGCMEYLLSKLRD